MIFRREYVFGKLNYNEEKHHDKIIKAVKKASELKIGVSFTITTQAIEFVDVEKEIKFDKGKLAFLLSTKTEAKNEITLNRKYDKFVKYVRELFRRVPTLTGKLDEQDMPIEFQVDGKA